MKLMEIWGIWGLVESLGRCIEDELKWQVKSMVKVGKIGGTYDRLQQSIKDMKKWNSDY